MNTIRLSLANGPDVEDIVCSKNLTWDNKEFVFGSEIFDKVEDPSFKMSALKILPRSQNGESDVLIYPNPSVGDNYGIYEKITQIKIPLGLFSQVKGGDTTFQFINDSSGMRFDVYYKASKETINLESGTRYLIKRNQNNPDPKMSSNHFTVTIDHDEITISDGDQKTSTNGTFVLYNSYFIVTARSFFRVGNNSYLMVELMEQPVQYAQPIFQQPMIQNNYNVQPVQYAQPNFQQPMIQNNYNVQPVQYAQPNFQQQISANCDFKLIPKRLILSHDEEIKML